MTPCDSKKEKEKKSRLAVLPSESNICLLSYV